MSTTKKTIAAMADEYVKGMAGSEILDALKYHLDKAGITLKFIRWSGADVSVARRVFEAVDAQGKIPEFLDVIQEDVEISLTLIDEQQFLAKDFDEFRYRNWLKAETDYVDIRGIGQRKINEAIVFPILELYTELYVRTGPSNLPELERMEKQRISLTLMVDAARCLVITGDAGSGKTTFLRYIARKHVLDRDKSLPIYLRLSDVYEFAMSLEGSPFDPQIFIDFCVALSDREGLNLNKEGIENRVREGKILWLFDSLDELPSDTARVEMVHVIEKAAQRWDKCKFVFTSRPLPVRSEAIPIRFDKVEIDSWSYTEIKSFLQAWTSLLYPDKAEDTRRLHWGTLLATITERSDLRNLAKNAVMVTAMAVVHYNDRRLPEGRADLIEALLYWLIRAKYRAGVHPYLTPKFIEDRYREIALAMLEAPGGRKRRVGMLWAARVIAGYFEGGAEEAIEFLVREETETGVIVRRGEGDLEFWHLSFLEYLAAKEIAGKTDDKWWSKIHQHLDDAIEWREVLIFVPACLNRLGSERVDLFFERLGESCTNVDLNTKAKRVALGSSILQDLRLSGYYLGDVQAWHRVLREILPLFESDGEDIPLETRYQVAVAYGLGGDERLRDFDKTWVQIQGGVFFMGAQTNDSALPNFDLYAAPWESPVCEISLETFEIRKFPITVREYEDFVANYGYQTRAFWSDGAWNWLQENEISVPLEYESQLLSPNCPITGVSWFEANAYCAWLTEKDVLMRDIEYRLPSEAEWEYVARRGLPAGQNFPWGNNVTPGERVEANFAWSGLRKKSPIGMFPKCITTDGVVDMFGNVEEWCLSIWTPVHTNYLNGKIEWKDETGNPRVVVKGGSTIRFSRLCRPSYRSGIRSQGRYQVVGFRPIRVRKG